MRKGTLIIGWQELKIEVEALPLDYNREAFDWFLSNLPLRAVQSHAVVSGEVMYVLNLWMKRYPPFRYQDLRIEDISKMPVGRVGVGGLVSGKLGMISLKYGSITENMSYPHMAQVKENHLPLLKEAGQAAWDSIYRSKRRLTLTLRRG